MRTLEKTKEGITIYEVENVSEVLSLLTDRQFINESPSGLLTIFNMKKKNSYIIPKHIFDKLMNSSQIEKLTTVYTRKVKE